MKIAITAQGPGQSDLVDPRFGRAAYFILHDTQTGRFTPIDNCQQADAAQGAGVQAAQIVVDQGAEILLTGSCGPKAFAVLQEAGVEIHSGIAGTVLDAIRDWKDGRLERLAAPDGRPRR